MGNSYQILILKRCITAAFFAVNLFGLWPFRFAHQNNQIKYSFIKAFYSMCLLLCAIVSFQVVGSINFNGENKAFFGSFTLRFVMMIYTQSILISFVVAYLGVHWSAKEIENVYVQFLNLVNEIGDSIGNIDLSGHIFGIAMRMIVVEIVQGAGSFIYMSTMESSSQILGSMPYLLLLLQLPPYAVRLQMNAFYGAVVAIDVFIRIMNIRLGNIVIKASESARHKHIKMCNYCLCSDEMDRLSTLHSNLVQAIKSINSIFSIHLVLWITTIIVTLTVQLLNQVILVIELVLNDSETAIVYNVYGCIAFILSTFDQLSISNACQRLNDSACETSSILHSMRISRDVDPRLRKSIDDFSIQMLTNELKIRGGYALDSTSTTMVITSIVSYFVVLLQFELAERNMSMNLKTT